MANNDPSFIIQSHLPDRYQLFFTDLSHDSQGNLILKKPPCPVEQMFLKDSCNGLLCMRDARERALYICNPFTEQSIEPPKPHLEKYRNNTSSFYLEGIEGSLNWLDTPLNIEHFSHMVDNSTPSFVLQSHLPDNTYQLLFTDLSHDSQGNLIMKKLPSVIKPMYLVDSCNGLLCMRDAKDRIIYIYNPFTRLCIELPEVNCPEQLGHLEFGFHPTTKEYKVVHVVQRYGPNPNSNQSGSIRYSEVHVLTMGSPAWRNLGKIPHGFIRTASKGTFKELTIPEKPIRFGIKVHVGSLNWLDTPLNNYY
ncbi:hypothetical protein CCACVL1_28962 [Corchorus capsularis]|uniref:F-box associated beta-propeller type 3 domain-containing protein n=1 Tax=Corchorus capsularis TaxID=210143 RepID=A0A1R3G4G3_COCAP|nr:hypothetical protein CCACVL1_28962 [Corchorus capsularis]